MKLLHLSWNANCLDTHVVELRHYLKDFPADVVHIQEARVSAAISLSFPGYQTYYSTRPTGTGGGLVTSVKRGLPAQEINSPVVLGDLTETLIIKVWVSKLLGPFATFTTHHLTQFFNQINFLHP